MCKGKQINFTKMKSYDTHGHGSNIVGIIGESLNPKTHCVLSIKGLDPKANSGDVMESIFKSYRYVLSDTSIRYLNLSLGGIEFSAIEKNLIKRMLVRGIKVIVAAGNERQDLDKCYIRRNRKICNKYYPASYREEFKFDNFYVVKSRASSTNYGKVVTDTFSGVNIGPKYLSYVPKMTGTSQATAQKTAQLLKNVVLIDRSYNDRKQTSDRKVRACR